MKRSNASNVFPSCLTSCVRSPLSPRCHKQVMFLFLTLISCLSVFPFSVPTPTIYNREAEYIEDKREQEIVLVAPTDMAESLDAAWKTVENMHTIPARHQERLAFCFVWAS